MTIEHKLLHAIRNNDKKQIELIFEEVYYKYGKLVGYIISKYVPKREDIEELINDVFVNFSKVLFDIKLVNIKYYLITQAKNTALDFLRKKTNKINLVYEEEYVLNTVNHDNRIYYELIDNLLTILNEEEVNIIILHSVYDYSFVTIANKKKKPITTIKSIYHRALKKYKKRRGE